ALRTRPASPSVSRCRVMACRVTPAPSLSRVMESGPSDESRPMSRNRVASASAANTGTASSTRTAAPLRDMARNVLELSAPPTVVHPECFGATRGRKSVEPGFDNSEGGTVHRILEEELDERRGLGRVVHRWIVGVGMPAVGKIALGVDSLDLHLQLDVLVPRMRDLPAGR